MRRLISTFLFVLFAINPFVLNETFSLSNDTAETPKISVIIPVYNAEKYLKECLDSVLNQSLKELEIICVNDGSTDNSLNILKQYSEKDNRVTVIDKKNGGVSSARNAGIEIAKGEYIAFVDSDDYLELNAYELAYSDAKSNNIDILNFGWRGFPNESNWDKWRSSPKEKMFINDSINAWFYCKIGANVNIWNKLYKRSFLIESGIRFSTKLKYSEDLYFNFLLFPKAKIIKFIPEKFYHYRRNNNESAMSNFDLKFKLKTQIELIKTMKDNWVSLGYIKGFKDSLLSFFVDWTSWLFSKIEDRNEASQFAKKFLDALGPNIYNSQNKEKSNWWVKKQLGKIEMLLKN